MPQVVFIILAVFAGVVFGGALFFFLRKKGEQTKGEQNQATLLIQRQLEELRGALENLRGTLDIKLGESTKAIQQQFGESTKIIRDVTERLTKLDETNRQVVGFADQLQNLQDILKNPKQRGIFGEYYLENLLNNAFTPKQYQMQYKLGKDDKTGKDLIADAVLFVGDKKLPIDSKFSLENYNRIIEEKDPSRREQLEKVFKNDLKERIDETAKYIRPNEGTTEFAFMFIPAEGIYYDLLINQVGAIKANTRDLIDYAINEKNVHIVSPTTFYVSLQALWQGMKAYQIQESTKEILKNVGLLEKHLKAHDEYLEKLGSHLGTVVNTYNSAYKEFGKIDKDVLRITGESIGSEPLMIDKPEEM